MSTGILSFHYALMEQFLINASALKRLASPIHILVCTLLWSLACNSALAQTKSDAESVHRMATGEPQRIVSLDFCTDISLMLLVSPARIAALTERSFDPQFSPLALKAQGFESHSGSIEEIIRLKPDLILAGDSHSELISALKQMHYPVINLKKATSLSDIAPRTRELGQLTETNAQADELLKQFQRLMRSAKKTVTNRSKRALIYAPNGPPPGAKTFKNELLQHIGLRNVAAELGIIEQGQLGVEQLLRVQPDLLLIDDAARNKNSLAQQFNDHPALRGLSNTQKVNVHSGLWDCATPLAAKLATQLAKY